jgi:hypothetical protein
VEGEENQNTVPSLSTAIGGEPSARFSRASLRPAAQVPPSSTRASGNSSMVSPRSCADQRRDPVEQRDGERAPLDHERRVDRIRMDRGGGLRRRSTPRPRTGRHCGIRQAR